MKECVRQIDIRFVRKMRVEGAGGGRGWGGNGRGRGTCKTSLNMRGNTSADKPTPLSITSMTMIRVASCATTESMEPRKS